MTEPNSAAAAEGENAWARSSGEVSLPEVHRSIVVPAAASFWRKLLAYSGPGFLVAVGYMDPGNWATDLEGGAKFGYTLLSVVLISNFMAILLQHLCIKLGVVTGRDLAQACRDHYSKPTVWFLWVLCEIAIAACDLAEVVGSAIALQLLFGIPLVWGCIITALDVLAVLFLQQKGFRYVEALVITLIATIALCFTAELIFSKPSFIGILLGFFPHSQIVTNPGMLYVSIGIIGATVMPHNLYLHSSIVQTRKFERSPGGKREAIKFATIDSTTALMFALFINAGILVLAAAAFHWSGHQDVAEIQDAHKLLSPLLGVGGASVLFAVALLASGQNSTLTGTLAGQIVMEGFMHIRLRPWLRRMITRALAIVPAVIIIGCFGESKTTQLLVGSQVVLSMQLGFAIWPLMRFTDEKAKMGEFANPGWIRILGWVTTAIIIVLNVKLLFDSLMPNAVLKAVYGFLHLAVPTPETAIFAMYHHILIPVENSPADQKILDHVKPLIRWTGAKVLLLHVADGFAARNFVQLKLAESEEIKEDRAYLERRRSEMEGEGFACETVLAMGEPSAEIIRLVNQRGIDLIAMATHGHRFMADLLYGETVNEVRHSVSVPILLLRASGQGK